MGTRYILPALPILLRGTNLRTGLVLISALPGSGGPSDLIFSRNPTKLNAPVESRGTHGREWTTSGTDDRYTYTVGITNPSALSMLWVGKTTGGTTFASVALHTSTSGNNGWYMSAWDAGTGKTSLTKGGVISAVSSLTASVTNYRALCAAGDATEADFVQHNLATGSLEKSWSVSITGSPVAGNGVFSLSCYGQGFASGIAGSNILAAIWTRRLSRSEMIWAVTNWEKLVTPLIPQRHVKIPTAAAGGFFSRYYYDMISTAGGRNV